MRVFCPEHRRGFFTPRQSPIRCENTGHVLGGLDFDGEANSPVEMRWQYCCNCEHFCRVNLDQNSLERCPVCARESSLRYVCDRCYTVSFEARTPVQAKNFTLTSEGVPQPSCPGCLQATSADLREHTCEGDKQSFITALASCPICLERLDIEPSFPAAVALYLRRTKARNKLNVTFDYESGMFVPVDDGEFVVISNGNEAIQPIVLPRTARFATGRAFYEFYQDYYHCAQPNAGEIHIVRPATVTRTDNGWRPQTPGVLEVIEDQPKKKVQSEPSVPEKKPLPTKVIKEQPRATTCERCGELVEKEYAFCWQCGNPMTAAQTAAPDPESEDEAPTVQEDVPSAYSPIFSWRMAKTPKRANSGAGSIKLIAIAVLGFLIMSLGVFALTRSVLRMDSVTAAQAVSTNAQTDSTVLPEAETKPSVAVEPVSQKAPAATAEDSDLKKLRDKRIAATPSDRPTILKAFARSERQYPNDYRFPYERAKLEVKSQSREKAFVALSAAAETAIKSGKADEMLSGLLADKTGDFRMLAQEKPEWTQLVAALKRKDSGLLP